MDAVVLNESPLIRDARSSSPGAVSWGAILAGAVAAAALSLILLALGSGLGLSSVSPWNYAGASAKAIGMSAIGWLLIMSALASGLGGYLTGRLRSKWSDASADEAYFRDTAHGLMAWAVATLVSAAILASAATSMVGVAVVAGGAAASSMSGATPSAGTPASMARDRSYFVDMLFRSNQAPAASNAELAPLRAEADGMLARALVQGEMSPEDRAYLGSVIERRTGISAADAALRATSVVTAAKASADAMEAKAREVAEVARKAAAQSALWVFVSLLLGAFCAAYAAMVGGRQRGA